jgi:hypothetical protein
VKNIATFTMPRPSKIYPIWELWYEKINRLATLDEGEALQGHINDGHGRRRQFLLFFPIAGLPDFSCYKVPKREKIYLSTTILSNGYKIYTNGRKMFQLTTKYANIIHSKAQNVPKLRFWFATIWQPCPIVSSPCQDGDSINLCF